MLSVARSAPLAFARSAGGLAAVALRSHAIRQQTRGIGAVPAPTSPGNPDYDADWNSLKSR